MKPPSFKYFAAQSVEEAVSLLAEHGDDARVLAGGQSLIQEMNVRQTKPRVLIDVNPIQELAFVQAENGTLALGAMTRTAAVEHDADIGQRLSMLDRSRRPRRPRCGAEPGHGRGQRRACRPRLQPAAGHARARRGVHCSEQRRRTHHRRRRFLPGAAPDRYWRYRVAYRNKCIQLARKRRQRLRRSLTAGSRMGTLRSSRHGNAGR